MNPTPPPERTPSPPVVLPPPPPLFQEHIIILFPTEDGFDGSVPFFMQTPQAPQGLDTPQAPAGPRTDILQHLGAFLATMMGSPSGAFGLNPDDVAEAQAQQERQRDPAAYVQRQFPQTRDAMVRVITAIASRSTIAGDALSPDDIAERSERAMAVIGAAALVEALPYMLGERDTFPLELYRDALYASKRHVAQIRTLVDFLSREPHPSPEVIVLPTSSNEAEDRPTKRRRLPPPPSPMQVLQQALRYKIEAGADAALPEHQQAFTHRLPHVTRLARLISKAAVTQLQSPDHAATLSQAFAAANL